MKVQKLSKTPVQIQMKDTYMEDVIAIDGVNNRFNLLFDSE